MAEPWSCGEAEASAGEGEQEGFGEYLAGEAKAVGAEGETGGEFGLAQGGARQQQVGHVGADDEEKEHAHAHNDAKGACEQTLRTVRGLPERNDALRSCLR